MVALLAVPAMAMGQGVFSKARPPVITVSPEATAQERLAARELADHLGQMLGLKLTPRDEASPPPDSITVSLAKRHGLQGDLGPEDVRLLHRDGRLYVLGGGPRGVIYAVNRLLHRQGVRWWTPWATQVPKRARLDFGKLDVLERPRFESRDPFWFHAFDRDWARRNGSNSMHARLTDEDGGKIGYAGFVHTFFALVPPEPHFKNHPEWFSLVGGVRKADGAQLCTSNPELRKFLVERVRERLRAEPSARIVSVSQNDWYGACECGPCKALNDAEGSPAAAVLDLANHAADQIREEFPDVAVDTLAYQYTRKAPRSMRPRPNVIVRLCSIECDFSKPLTDPANKAFAQDLVDWSRLTQRLYVWNYVTNFPNYVMPFPNWEVIGPNQRFFAQNGVKGLFEQGAYQSFGASMAEMHAWVQAQLLWNPDQDDRALRREFLRGYYGPAAPPIERYLDRLATAARLHPMTIWAGPNAPFFDAKTVLEAEQLWQKAEKAVERDADLRWRVRQGQLAIRYVVLSRWVPLRQEAHRQKLRWPLPESRKAVADAWIALATGPGPKGWSPITHMNEAGLSPARWIERFALDPEPILRTAAPALPADLRVPTGAKVVSVQDDEARLIQEGQWGEFRPDPAASDRAACRLNGGHREWAYQLPVPEAVRTGEWTVYVVVRVEPGSDAATTAFSAGVFSADLGRGLGGVTPTNAEAGSDYRTYRLTRSALTKGCYVWVAPAAGGSKAVWIDRIVFVRE